MTINPWYPPRLFVQIKESSSIERVEKNEVVSDLNLTKLGPFNQHVTDWMGVEEVITDPLLSRESMILVTELPKTSGKLLTLGTAFLPYLHFSPHPPSLSLSPSPSTISHHVLSNQMHPSFDPDVIQFTVTLWACSWYPGMPAFETFPRTSLPRHIWTHVPVRQLQDTQMPSLPPPTPPSPLSFLWLPSLWGWRADRSTER